MNDDQANPLRPARLTVAQLCGRSARWAAVAALIVAAVCTLATLVYALVSGERLEAGALAGRCVTAGAVSFGLLFLGRLWRLSRELQDRAFTYLGFFATFFGLGMLIVFFVQLGVEVGHWLKVSPMLIDLKNHEYKERLRLAEVELKYKEEAFDYELERELAKDKELLAFYRGKIRGQWVDLLRAAEKDRKDELDAKWKAAQGVADKNAVKAIKIDLVLEYLKKSVADYPRVKDKGETVYPLDEAVYLGMDTMLVEIQNVAEQKREAELGIRVDKGPGALAGHFLTSMPSDVPQDAGIWPALIGSLWLALITMLTAVPIGVGAALYLEEYKHSGWLGKIIQVNINNLAGVPSVVYGILGAFVFVELIFKPIHLNQAALLHEHALNPGMALGLWDRLLLWLPSIAARNALGGGLTLGLLTLPVVIVASQEAIRAVPSSIRHGAYALGATRWQTIWHQVLPLARPGILTGTILAISRAIGEAAPLILFGALLLVQQTPTPFSGFTIMPMQIFGWADRAAIVVPIELEHQLPIYAQHGASTAGLLASNQGMGPLLAASSGHITGRIPTQTVDIWLYNAALASLLLLVVLLCLNGIAIYLRNRAQLRTRL